MTEIKKTYKNYVGGSYVRSGAGGYMSGAEADGEATRCNLG